MPITMLNGLGCDCQQQNSFMGFGVVTTAKQVFDSLQSVLIYTTQPITVFNKTPDDWFPLVESSKQVNAGSFIGSATDYQQLDNGEVWIKANAVSPGWFKYNPSQLRTELKTALPPLTKDQKQEIIEEVFIQSTPGGEVVVATADIADAAYDTAVKGLKFTEGLIKALPVIVTIGAIGAAWYGYKVYVKPTLNGPVRRKPKRKKK